MTRETDFTLSAGIGALLAPDTLGLAYLIGMDG